MSLVDNRRRMMAYLDGQDPTLGYEDGGTVKANGYRSILFDPQARREAERRERVDSYGRLYAGLERRAGDIRARELAARSGTIGPRTETLRERVGGALAGDGNSQIRRDIAEGLVGSSGVGTASRLSEFSPVASLADLLPFDIFGIDESLRDDDYESAALGILPGAAGKGVRGAKAAKAAVTGALMPFASGGAVAKSGKKAIDRLLPDDLPTPAIRREERLFDYDRLHEIPDVPQEDLPRTVPARGVSARVGDLVNDRKVVKGVEGTIDRGLQMGGREWYNTEQLRQHFIAELGEEEGNAAYRRYMDMVAATSPRSRVGENARNASYYYTLDRQGLPMPAVEDKLPAPYGHLAQKNHKLNAQAVVSEDGWDVFKNPKPASFVENLAGNQRPVTVDAHAMKLPALLSRDPRFLATSYQSAQGAERINPRKLFASGELSMDDALDTPAMWASAPEPNEYGALERMYQDIAQRKGISPAQAQASAWVGGGEDTGLQSSADPFLKVFEERLAITADKTGLSKEDVLRKMIRGEMPLYREGGYVTHGEI